MLKASAKRAKKSEKPTPTNAYFIFDLDDHFFSWVECFIPAHESMVDFWVEKTGWNKESLLAQLKEVHVAQFDTEYLGALKHTELWQRLNERDSTFANEVYKQGVEEFESMQKLLLKFQPGVELAIKNLREVRAHLAKEGKDCKFIALTDAKTRAAMFRLDALGLLKPDADDGMQSFFEAVFCREERDTEHLKREEWFLDIYKDRFHERRIDHMKPDAGLLSQILVKYAINPKKDFVCYSGDSASSDGIMANAAGIRFFFNEAGRTFFTSELFAYLDKIDGLPSSHSHRRDILKAIREAADAEGKDYHLPVAEGRITVTSESELHYKRIVRFMAEELYTQPDADHDYWNEDVIVNIMDEDVEGEADRQLEEEMSYDEIPNDFNKIIVGRVARLDNGGRFLSLRTPTPPSERVQQQVLREERAEQIVHFYNATATRKGHADLATLQGPKNLPHRAQIDQMGDSACLQKPEARLLTRSSSPLDSDGQLRGKRSKRY